MVVPTVYGANSTVLYAPSPDVLGLVLNDLSQAVAQMSKPIPFNYNSVSGLNVPYSYAGVLGSKVRQRALPDTEGRGGGQAGGPKMGQGTTHWAGR